MSHELNELAPGVHSYAGAREDAWHRLGVTLDSEMTAAQALEAAHLAGWDVRKIALTGAELSASGVTTVAIPDRYATVYTNPVTKAVQYLGVVGGFYTPIQNEEHTELLDAVAGEGGAHFESAGSLRGGKETFVTMKMPETMNVGGKDPIDLKLVALNSHDGSSAFRFLVTPIRVVCANTQAAALSSARASFSLRHTINGSKGIVAEARQALDLTFKYAEEFQAAAERMLDQALADDEFERIVLQAFGAGEAASARQKNVVATHLAGVKQVWKDSPTMDGITGTRWGGYQAVTEYTDHFMAVRGNDPVARAMRTATAHSMQVLKTDAFKAFATV